MGALASLSHLTWERKCPVVRSPKRWRGALRQQLRPYLDGVLLSGASQKESRIEEAHLLAGYLHTMISIPPKYAVA